MALTKRRSAFALGVAMIVGLGCSSGGSSGRNPSPPGTEPPGTTPPGTTSPGAAGPTAVGTPTGAPTTAKVGAAGGTLESADKRVRLVVPPGALASDADLKMTPISNETPLGLGYAVRLEPEGTTFAVPAKLVFAYAAWGESSVPELLLGATQQADKSWKAASGAALDAGAKTITVDVPHFSDWSLSACARLTSSTYVLVAGQEANLAVEEQCEAPAAGTTLGAVSRTTQPVEWTKKDKAGNPGPGTLTPNGATAKLVGDVVTGDPLVRISAEWRSRGGTRVLSDEIATGAVVSFAIEGKSVNASTAAFVTTLQGKTTVNGSSEAGTISVNVTLSGVGSATTNPEDGLVAAANVGETSYEDLYTKPCTEEVRALKTTVTIGRANRERQYITGTIDGTMAIQRGEITCQTSPEPNWEEVPVTGAFFAIWQNYDMGQP